MILMPNSLAQESGERDLTLRMDAAELIRTKTSLDSTKPDCIVATLRRKVAHIINR
jgi:hypothetical protein